jgi:ubiquinone/menaquinone biosynthesis C-methylase UbiE
MREFDLLRSPSKIMRDVSARRKSKEKNRRLSMKFGWEYFDGPREQGYGGYSYDGRWIPVARRAIDFFSLKPGDRVLDIGCAKGFLVKDLMDSLPDLQVYGVDISDYALAHCHPDVRGRLYRGNCARLPHADEIFAAVFAINTIHNLDRAGCIQALREIERVAPGRGFVQVDAYRNERERAVFDDWMLTAQTHGRPEDWLQIFQEAGYTGSYYWTILEVDENIVL